MSRQIVWLLRRMALSVVSAITPAGTPFYASFISAIMTLSITLQVYVQPYKRTWETTLEVVTVSLLLISFAAVTATGLTGENDLGDWNSSITAWTLSILNLAFAIAVVLRLAYEYFQAYILANWHKVRMMKWKIRCRYLAAALLVLSLCIGVVVGAVFLSALVELVLVLEFLWLATIVYG